MTAKTQRHAWTERDKSRCSKCGLNRCGVTNRGPYNTHYFYDGEPRDPFRINPGPCPGAPPPAPAEGRLGYMQGRGAS